MNNISGLFNSPHLFINNYNKKLYSLMERKKIKKTLCQIAGSTTNDVCTALNAVVPAIETEFGKIDLNTLDIKPDGDNLVLTVSTITEEHT